MEQVIEDNNVDAGVDAEIANCINPSALKSFFLFAGAGSGKTRSLVSALEKFNEDYGSDFRLKRQRIAIITYTNAACDEIMHRTKYNPLFQVSTIHSFVWELIRPFQEDIREWIRIETANEIAELQQAAAKGRAGTKAAMDREASIQSKSKLLDELDSIRLFTYSPTGENKGKSSLNHSQVIKIGADFLMNRPMMQAILICKYPIVFIDESQDTKKELMEALFALEKKHSGKFCLGLFGDTMQRIYNDGKLDLGINLPGTWVTPAKKLNHRCPTRVITLINKIRSRIDKQVQQPINGQIAGTVRLFIVDRENKEKTIIEKEIAKEMSVLSYDEAWNTDKEVMKLTLEHHMAASRMGFLDIFKPLAEVGSIRTSVVDGTSPALRFFTHLILPLSKALKDGDEFEVAYIVKTNSNLLSEEILKNSKQQSDLLKKARECVLEMGKLWSNNTDPTLLQVLLLAYQQGLFTIPQPLSIIAKRLTAGDINPIEEENEMELTSQDLPIKNWEQALNSPFSQIESYYNYVAQTSAFGTHQGVKGLEFDRVMAILDDEEAKGFLFSYDKIFGVKELSKQDLLNEKEGNDTAVLRTLRLFYVVCSRAKKSLAIVAYTDNPDSLKQNAIDQGWFNEEEIRLL